MSRPRRWLLALFLTLAATPAAAQPLEPPNEREHAREWRFIEPPSVACPDQQTIDEVETLRRLGDREAEAITRRSYGCGPVLRPRPGPFER
jgi:hypothetical protein